MSGLVIGLEDIIQAPQSTRNDPQGARARLNLLAHAHDGTKRLFIADMAGKLYILPDPDAAEPLATYLDFEATFANFRSTGWSDGFNSFAFHPAFSENGKLYTVHTEQPGSGTATFATPRPIGPAYQSVVIEWTATDPSNNTFDGTHRELLRIDQPRTNHPIGQLGFNPNVSPGHPDYGLLYIASGDGGTLFAEAPENLQRLDSPLGTILRIDPSGSNSANGHYGIPTDNPFAATNDSSVLPEIWAYGLRNHHRFSWDTGGDQRLYISDIGENNLEEINLGLAGANYGWPIREGTFRLDPTQRRHVLPLPDDDADASFTYPIAQYDHDEGVAVTGGYVYRGTALPRLFGHYVFGDIRNGRVFHFDTNTILPNGRTLITELEFVHSGTQQTLHEIMGRPNRIDLRFGQDQSGEIYLLTKRDGMIRRLVPVGLRISQLPPGGIQLRWVQGSVESAPSVNGPWTVMDQRSPSRIETSSSAQFFRLRP